MDMYVTEYFHGRLLDPIVRGSWEVVLMLP